MNMIGCNHGSEFRNITQRNHLSSSLLITCKLLATLVQANKLRIYITKALDIGSTGLLAILFLYCFFKIKTVVRFKTKIITRTTNNKESQHITTFLPLLKISMWLTLLVPPPTIHHNILCNGIVSTRCMYFISLFWCYVSGDLLVL